MTREDDRSKLEHLAETERKGDGDAVRVVVFYVKEYRKEHGSDSFINEFVYNYLDAHREKYSTKPKHI